MEEVEKRYAYANTFLAHPSTTVEMVKLSFKNTESPCLDGHMVEDVWNSKNTNKYAILEYIDKANRFCMGGKYLYDTLLKEKSTNSVNQTG